MSVSSSQGPDWASSSSSLEVEQGDLSSTEKIANGNWVPLLELLGEINLGVGIAVANEIKNTFPFDGKVNPEDKKVRSDDA